MVKKRSKKAGKTTGTDSTGPRILRRAAREAKKLVKSIRRKIRKKK